jgi:hypothetical protein
MDTTPLAVYQIAYLEPIELSQLSSYLDARKLLASLWSPSDVFDDVVEFPDWTTGTPHTF